MDAGRKLYCSLSPNQKDIVVASSDEMIHFFTVCVMRNEWMRGLHKFCFVDWKKIKIYLRYEIENKYEMIIPPVVVYQIAQFSFSYVFDRKMNNKWNNIENVSEFWNDGMSSDFIFC
eukprot:468676_1